jgi:uncharacterized protein YdhG (YjbR/CyaY superfamily)
MAKARPVAAKTVDDYIDSQSEPLQPVLKQLRLAIRHAAPAAEELISYQIPTYKYKGPLIHFAVFKDHCSLIIINRLILQKFGKELKTFKTTGTTIHFTPEHPLPLALVQKIVRIRMKDNGERQVLKKLVKDKKK